MPEYASHLRVYEPLAAFPAGEQRRWEGYASSGKGYDRLGGLRAQARAALVAAIGLPPASDVEHAFVHRVGDDTYVCPWRTQLRTLEAMADFRASLPDEIADAFIPRALAEDAARALAQLRTAAPEIKSHIQTVTWQVPLRWFLLFAQEDRRIALDPERSVIYVTSMSQARKRVARSLGVLRRTVDDQDLLRDVAELGEWLEDYHPHSLVELDYGDLVQLFDDDELQSDESAAEIAQAVAALGAGEPDEAFASYRQVSLRWGAVRAVEVAN